MKKKVQSFESLFFVSRKKVSILWVVVSRKKVNSVSRTLKKRFNSLSRAEKKVQFFESYWKKKFGSWRSKFEKKKKEGSSLWVMWKKSNSLSHMKRFKSVEFSEWIIFFQRGSILRVTPAPRKEKEKGFDSLSHIFQKRQKMVQFCESCFKRVQFLESYWEKSSILWVIFSKKDKLKLWVSCLSKKTVFNFYESCWKEGFNSVIIKKWFSSVSHVEKKSILWVIKKKGSIIWVIFSKSFFNGSILWVIFQKFFFKKNKKNNSVSHFLIRFNHLSHKRFNSLRHLQEKRTILWDTLWKVQFLETHCKKFNSLRHIVKSSILWDTL